ncbi:hypothetical protein V6N13_122542 [Hibiscus sabdariffa]
MDVVDAKERRRENVMAPWMQVSSRRNKKNEVGRDENIDPNAVMRRSFEGNKFGVLRIEDGDLEDLEVMGNGGDGTGGSPIVTKGNNGTHNLIVGFREANGVSSTKSGNDCSTQVFSRLAVSRVESSKTNMPVASGGKSMNNSVKISELAMHQTDSDKRQGEKDIVVASTEIVVPISVTLDPSNNMMIWVVDKKDMG